MLKARCPKYKILTLKLSSILLWLGMALYKLLWLKGSLCHVVSRRDQGKILVNKSKLLPSCGRRKLLTYVKDCLLSNKSELCSFV